MYQVFKPTILNSHSLRLMESQSKSTAKPQSLRQAPVHCDAISKLPVITSRCKSTCDQPMPPKEIRKVCVATCMTLRISFGGNTFADKGNGLFIFQAGGVFVQAIGFPFFQSRLFFEYDFLADGSFIFFDIILHSADFCVVAV